MPFGLSVQFVKFRQKKPFGGGSCVRRPQASASRCPDAGARSPECEAGWQVGPASDVLSSPRLSPRVSTGWGGHVSGPSRRKGPGRQWTAAPRKVSEPAEWNLEAPFLGVMWAMTTEKDDGING